MTSTHKEAPIKSNSSPILLLNMNEIVKLTKQIESIKDSFKVINHETDDSIFAKFGF